MANSVAVPKSRCSKRNPTTTDIRVPGPKGAPSSLNRVGFLLWKTDMTPEQQVEKNKANKTADMLMAVGWNERALDYRLKAFYIEFSYTGIFKTEMFT